jgi:beta-lactamase class A
MSYLIFSLLSMLPVSKGQVPLKITTPRGEAAYHCDAAYPLTESNKLLVTEIKKIIKNRKWKNLVETKMMSISVVDFSPMKRIHYAGINDDKMVYTASLPKIVALFAYAQLVKDKKLKWTDEARKKLSKMINKSDNRAATWAIKTVGLDYLEEILKRPGYCFYGIKKGGIWLGKPYQKSLPAKRDPLFNISHGSTSRQIARWYTLLYKGLLVGPIGNQRIVDTMRPPQVFHKFVGGLRGKKDIHIFARKSGTWRTFHSDSIIVEHKNGVRYSLTGLVNDKNGGVILKKLIGDIDQIIRKGSYRKLPLVPFKSNWPGK